VRPAIVWVVCGAAKGVGKTSLAQALCRVLPRARYAKLGHGKPREDGPRPYFTDPADLEKFVAERRGEGGHLVVESNSWAREGRGDVIVFLEAARGRTDLRPDAGRLRRRAHVVVGRGGSDPAWRRTLGRVMADRRRREAVVAVLRRQAEWTPPRGIEVRTKVWFSVAGERVFGAGLARLCGEISRHRSLAEAARACGVSYRHAWSLLRNAGRRLGRPLTVPQAGGARGGGSGLTAEGRRLLDLYGRVAEEAQARSEACFREGGKGVR
jgi:molybdate transport repressor ModE-like protein